MATYFKENVKQLVGDQGPGAGGRWALKPRSLGKPERVRSVPRDEVGRHLLTLFTVYPELKLRFRSQHKTLNDFSKELQGMPEGTKTQLLARVERYLGAPRSEQEFLD